MYIHLLLLFHFVSTNRLKPYPPFLLGTIRSQVATNSLKLNMLSVGPALAAAKAFDQIPSLPGEEPMEERA